MNMHRDANVLLFVLLVAAILAGCAQEPVLVRVSENYVTEARDLHDFHNVTLNGNGHLNAVHTGSESFSITVADNVLPHMELAVRNGTLFVQLKPNVELINDHGYTVTLTTQDLDGLTLAGNSSAIVKGIDAEQWQATLQGNSNARLYGNANRQQVTVEGNSFYDAQELASGEAKVQADGNGHVTLRVSDKLDVTLKGLASVEYIGTPLVQEKVENLASVRQRAIR